MSLFRTAWLGLLREVGTAFLQVLKAEATALGADLSASRRQAIKAVLVMSAALILAGWVVALLSLALIAYLQQFLATWLAILLVALLLTAGSVALLLWGRSILDSVRGPGDLLQERIRNHGDWLRGQVSGLGGEDAEAGDGEG